eukprot:GHVO01014883.1.p1 GENE.GHVO01014883.1~~GHVO01014883.1.p1  ORF type:complete len:399 (+),score=64.86 GHVO01014883.1:143-1339(+)
MDMGSSPLLCAGKRRSRKPPVKTSFFSWASAGALLGAVLLVGAFSRGWFSVDDKPNQAAIFPQQDAVDQEAHGNKLASAVDYGTSSSGTCEDTYMSQTTQVITIPGTSQGTASPVGATSLNENVTPSGGRTTLSNAESPAIVTCGGARKPDDNKIDDASWIDKVRPKDTDSTIEDHKRCRRIMHEYIPDGFSGELQAVLVRLKKCSDVDPAFKESVEYMLKVYRIKQPDPHVTNWELEEEYPVGVQRFYTTLKAFLRFGLVRSYLYVSRMIARQQIRHKERAEKDSELAENDDILDNMEFKGVKISYQGLKAGLEMVSEFSSNNYPSLCWLNKGETLAKELKDAENLTEFMKNPNKKNLFPLDFGIRIIIGEHYQKLLQEDIDLLKEDMKRLGCQQRI